MLGIEHSLRNFAFGLAPPPPLPVFSGLNHQPPLCFFLLSITPSFIFTFTIGYNPLPRPNVQFIFPMCFLPSNFIMISMSNPNVQHVFIFFISARQIVPRIKINNMNLYAESTESQLLIEIQGWNNCMFGKHKHLRCFLLFNRAWFFLFCNILSKRDAKLR